MGTFSASHLLIVLGVAVLLFGSAKLPEMARALGKSARILKSEAAAMKNDGANDGAAAAEPALPPSQKTA
ncbi:Sec-independent protein translocase subunit TatA [Streptomyces sp. TRM64462]|uniref:Sec-independent protein translocase subunit TatA n=1 Tax=Streptomyces sp. TRM64462 TaxID=2741726 RepID=UPI001586BC5D